MSRKLTRALAWMLVLMMLCATAAQAKAGYLLEDAAFYKKPKQTAKVRDTLPAGTQIKITGMKGKWARVRHRGTVCYILRTQVAVGEAEPDEPNEPDEPDKPDNTYQTLKPGDTGEAVKTLQRRLKELEWFYGEIGGNYKTLTTQAVKSFQEAADLEMTGVADPETQRLLYRSDAPRNTLDSTAKPVDARSEKLDWWTSDIQSIFARGKTVVVTDVDTGLSWHETRYGGTNHADVQPTTAADTAVMKKAYGGEWSWTRRAIWVSIGKRKFAASMNGMPHGSGSIANNNFDGHHCIHFLNSRTHGSNVVDAMHQAAVDKAYRAG